MLSLVSGTGLCAPTVLQNIQGHTLTPEGTLKHFDTLVFEHGKVLFSGPSQGYAVPEDATQVDGKGKYVLPGLIDAHGHLLGLGATLLQVDVRGLATARDTALATEDYAKRHPELSWITGRGWNQELWASRAFPTAAQLDEFIKDRPVWLERVDGHAGWANSKALELAGITADTLDPPGGKILRDSEGNPTGVLIDNAMPLLEKTLPKAGESFYQASLDAATEHLLALGITSMHDAGIPADVYDFYMKRAKNHALGLRIYAMIAATDPKLMTLLEAGHQKDDRDMLYIRSVKAYGDGALGSRGAALIHPYQDAPENTGLLVTRQVDLKPLYDSVLGSGFQLNFHAIGDRANRLALDQFADTFKRLGGAELRHRIEHSQVVHPDDIPRFKALGIIPSMQPTHATSDMNMAEDRLGKQRLKGAYAWQTFLKQGSPVAFGSDFPVELANPFYGLHAAVTRQDRGNMPDEGWIAEESVTVQQALKGFTLDAAYAAHQENILGTLSVGKWADFIVVDQNIFDVSAEDIWRTQVLETWLAGEKVYDASSPHKVFTDAP